MWSESFRRGFIVIRAIFLNKNIEQLLEDNLYRQSNCHQSNWTGWYDVGLCFGDKREQIRIQDSCSTNKCSCTNFVKEIVLLTYGQNSSIPSSCCIDANSAVLRISQWNSTISYKFLQRSLEVHMVAKFGSKGSTATGSKVQKMALLFKHPTQNQ